MKENFWSLTLITEFIYFHIHLLMQHNLTLLLSVFEWCLLLALGNEVLLLF